MTKTTTSRYIIKCDECKETIGETDSLSESAAGGRCDKCIAILREGTDIYYTGDMANHESYGTIEKITDGRFGRNIAIRMEDDHIINVSPASFSPGPGRRFYTKAEWLAERAAKIAEMQARFREMDIGTN